MELLLVLACLSTLFAQGRADDAIVEPRAWAAGQVVKTTSGPVTGRKATSRGSDNVSEYLGIPFAAPPVGKLRWQPPQNFTPVDAIDATKWGPSCAQAGLPTSSEDCLTLNIWTKPQTGSEKKAVMINIYGGGFNVGSSNTRYLVGSTLANSSDVVVVSMNYRLNLFGFPGAPGLQDNNLGMLDIRKSIEWIRDNIAQFGGDPSRMILFGESAGGGAVDYYSFAYPDDPIVKGLIIMSGSVYTRGIAVPAGGNYGAWYKVSETLGCGGAAAGNATVECLRQKPYAELIKLILPGPRTPGKTFGPVHDGRVIYSEDEYSKRAQLGKLARIPTLIGNTDNEAGFFTLMRQISKQDQQSLNACFTCTAARSAFDRFNEHIPVWRYRWHGDFANNRRKDGMGAFHGSELPFVFGAPRTMESPENSTDTPEEAQVGAQMMRIWSTFAKDPAKGLDTLGLKQYDPGQLSLVLLGKDNKPDLRVVKGSKYDDACLRYELGNDSIDVIMERSKPTAGGIPGMGGSKGTGVSPTPGVAAAGPVRIAA